MLTAASVMISGLGMARHVHDEAVADASRRADAGVARHDGAHQLVGVQAALHQGLGAARAHELDRLGRRIVAVQRTRPARRRRCRAPACAATSRMRARGPTRIGFSRPRRAAFDRAFQRDRVAGMGDRRRHRRVLARHGDQPIVLLVTAFSGSRRLRQACEVSPVAALGGRASAEQLLDALQPLQPFLGQRAAGAQHLGQRVEPGAARLLALGQQARDGAHGALLVEAKQHVLVAEQRLHLVHAEATVGRLQAADGLQHGEAAFVDAALRAAGCGSARGRRASGRPPTSKRCLQVGLPPRLDGLAGEVAVDARARPAPSRSQARPWPAPPASRRWRGTVASVMASRISR